MEERSSKMTEVVLQQIDAKSINEVYSNHFVLSFMLPQDITLDFYQLQPQTASNLGNNRKIEAAHKTRVVLSPRQATALCSALIRGLHVQSPINVAPLSELEKIDTVPIPD